MQPTSIDVIAAALEDSTAMRLAVPSSPDGAITLLFCEIANISTIRAALPDERLTALLADQRLIIGNIASRHGGDIEGEHEDGFVITFDSAHAALHCAIEVQRSFAVMTVQAEASVELRVGLHTGFVIGEHEHLYGRNFLLGARIAGQAAGGEIIVSDKVREYTHTDSSFHFSARGEHHFRGLHGEHELFAVEWKQPEPGQGPL
jgi:adenylate cyclase